MLVNSIQDHNHSSRKLIYTSSTTLLLTCQLTQTYLSNLITLLPSSIHYEIYIITDMFTYDCIPNGFMPAAKGVRMYVLNFLL